METATDDPHEPYAEDQEMWEEPNQCMDEETEDPFAFLQHNLDKDLTTTPSATEHSEPNEPPSGDAHGSSIAVCSAAMQQQQLAVHASSPGRRL